MPWRNDTNKNDCGVYAMRHMETYMGQKMKDWNPGLRKNGLKQLRYMRAKYSAALLSYEMNDHREDNIAVANDHYKFARSDEVDVEKMLEIYVK